MTAGEGPSQADASASNGSNADSAQRAQNKRPASSHVSQVEHTAPAASKVERDTSEEEIAKKRAARQAKREQKLAEKGANRETVPEMGVNAFGFNVKFMQRELAKVTRKVASQPRAKFTLMTYNILAQSLVRREMYPDAGEAIKWKNRQQVLKAELAHYDPDVLCMQECGADMFDPVLKDFLDERGYRHKFHLPENKTHGLVVALKKRQFELVNEHALAYDDRLAPDSERPAAKAEKTNNSGLFCVLKHLETDTTLTLGTTHLFWHPKGTAERARQMRLFIAETIKTDAERGDNSGNIIMAGDFNTEPIDPTYLAATAIDRGTQTLEPGNDDADRPKAFELDEEGVSIMDESWASHCAPHPFADPPAAETEPVGKPWQALIDDIVRLPRLQSQYALHYHSVHPENTRDKCGEPKCTNFAPKYRGTLDYIYTVESVHPHTIARGADGSGDAADEAGAGRDKSVMADRIHCSALLKLPLDTDIEKGQPYEGQFPSDHCCIMAEFEIL